MRTVNKLVLICLFFVQYAAAQSPGFFEKRGILEINAFGSVPLFQNIFAEKGYVERSGKLQSTYYLKDYGFRVALGRLYETDQGFAVELGYREYQVNALKDAEINRQYLNAANTVSTDYLQPKVAFLDMQEFTIMPKILFRSDDGQLPAGFTQEIGIGYTVTQFKLTSPKVENAGTGSYSSDSISLNMVDAGFSDLRGLTYMYGFKLNFPVTKSLLLNIGFRYSYSSLFGKKKYREMELSEEWLSGREIWSRVNQRRQLGIISFGVGATICF